ncbi:unnamed protein product [Cylindrotheca closterium]|uniref:ABC transporter domain-containing protein n=1 Tax=Cylindrotheca closterium TaxID=2856 RepID=A0AAD2CV73_9STRA|nr:unnamed protein product [Cylindrotheca closterium]
MVAEPEATSSPLQQQQRQQQQQLPTLTSDSTCTYHGHSINLHVGLTHDSCLLFDPSDVSLVRKTITGLVGTNGAGKSSLAKVLASKQIPNFPQASLSIQYVSSHEAYAFDEAEFGNMKPREYMASIAQEKIVSLSRQIEQLERKLETGDPEVDVEDMAVELAELYDKQEELETLSDIQIQKTIEQLGFDRFLDKPVSQLSCGWRYKCRLVAAFTSRPDILIIDEPSFLDQTSTDWLIEKTKDAALHGNTMVLIISHKEVLLEKLCDRIWYINSANHKLSMYHCGYESFKATHQADMDHAAKTIDAFDSKMKSAESSLKTIRTQLDKREANLKQKTTQNADKRFIKGKNKEAKQKADKSAASKLKQLKHDVSDLEEIKHQAQRERTKQLKLEGTCSSGTLALFQEVSFRYDERDPLMFQYMDARIDATDRILLKGANGAGKSTFLKLALGELEPTEGSITRNVQALYFPQTSLIEMTIQHGNETALDYLWQKDKNLTQAAARHHLGFFGIPNVALRKIYSLSAGQRVRLWLAQQQLGGKLPSLLILDEVSENLDVDTKNSLLEVLNSFVGSTIVVSHDEDFCTQFQPSQIWTIEDCGRLRVEFPSY